MSYTDVWKRPFTYDDCGYIWSGNNVMTFTVDIHMMMQEEQNMRDFCNNMVAALNDDECKKYSGVHIKDGCDLYVNNKLIGYFRGWGHLTGKLGLKKKKAVNLQDELINEVLSKISEN